MRDVITNIPKSYITQYLHHLLKNEHVHVLVCSLVFPRTHTSIRKILNDHIGLLFLWANQIPGVTSLYFASEGAVYTCVRTCNRLT